MPTFTKTSILAFLVAAVSAYTPPTNPTWGPLLTPNLSSPVTQGQTYSVTWDPETHPTDGVTVSLVLCQGPSTNCVNQPNAIVSGLPAAQKSYSWAVPCSLAAGTQNTATGYGMLIIVDQTGEFQYSTQFSVLANPSCGSSGSTSSSSSSSSSSASIGSVPGYPGWGNQTTSATTSITNTWTNTATVTQTSIPSSIVTATSSNWASTTQAYPTAQPPTASPSPSTFVGAGAVKEVGDILAGAVAGVVGLLVL